MSAVAVSEEYCSYEEHCYHEEQCHYSKKARSAISTLTHLSTHTTEPIHTTLTHYPELKSCTTQPHLRYPTTSTHEPKPKRKPKTTTLGNAKRSLFPRTNQRPQNPPNNPSPQGSTALPPYSKTHHQNSLSSTPKEPKTITY